MATHTQSVLINWFGVLFVIVNTFGLGLRLAKSTTISFDPRPRNPPDLMTALAGRSCFAAGFLFHHQIEEHLFNVYAVAIALIGGGLVILAVERREFRPTVAVYV
jgi:undecaprenyl pyrophosphate phosphatase UppP